MMSKKLKITSLIVALMFVFSTVAMAATPAGIYIGGTVGKYYSLTQYVGNSQAAIADMQRAMPLSNIAYVDSNGKIARADEVVSKGGVSAAARDIKEGDLVAEYKDPAGNIIKPEVTPSELKVVSVSAIDSTSFKVTFSKAASSALPSNFVVTQKDTGDRFYVSNVTLASDKMSATVTLYDAMTSGKTYVVATSGIKDVNGNVQANDSDEFTYTQAVPASIAFTSTTIPSASSVDLDNYVVVKDANGNVLKSGFTVDFAANVSVDANNCIDTRSLSSVIVNATVHGTQVTTGNVVLTVESPTATTVDKFDLGKFNSENTSYVPVVTLYANNTGLDKDGNVLDGPFKLVATYKDQFGNAYTTTTNQTFTSLTPTVVAVDVSSGQITPVQPGTAYVRVTNKNASKTIQLNVLATPKATTMEVSSNTITVVGSTSAPAGSVKITVKDQYGNKVTGTPQVDVTNSDTTGVLSGSYPTWFNLSNGEYTFSIQGAKAGTATLTFTLRDDPTIKQTVTVTAISAGTVSGYSVEAIDDTIDLNPGANNDTATIKVFQVDANGNKIADVSTDSSISYVLPTSESLIEATATNKNVFQNASGNTATGTTTVTVKAGTLTIGTATIKTINTTDSVASAELINPLVVLNTQALVSGFDLAAVAKNIKMTTKAGRVLDDNVSADLEMKKEAIAYVLTSNSDAVTVTGNPAKDVAAQTISGAKKTSTLTVVFADSSIAPIAFNVDVYDVTAPNAPTITNNGYINAADVSTNGYNVTGTAEAGATVTITVRDSAATPHTVSKTVTAATDGTFTAALTTAELATLVEGTVTISATATDVAGNVSTAVIATVILDKTAPAAASTNPIVAANGNGTSGTIDAGDTITISFSEPVKVANLAITDLALSNSKSFGTGATLEAMSPTNGYATSFKVTLGDTPTVAENDTITISKDKVEDIAGNKASADVTFTVPAASNF